jgi:lipopolysaccharide/colanic/teichoic acid biosynthesis glycosyltransferase
VKRLFDIAASALLLVALTPLLVAVALLVRAKLGSPVLFRQRRPGLHRRPFVLYKFRTMADIKDANGNIAPDAQRLTTVGRFLRESSLDELPELWNVLKGDMSLVGPRPLLMQYLPLYTPSQDRRHDVRPGMTGWAQIHGRNGLGWDERFAHDVWYVDNRSLWLDLRILTRTLGAVVRREGISAPGFATMSPFTGSAYSAQPDRDKGRRSDN